MRVRHQMQAAVGAGRMLHGQKGGPRVPSWNVGDPPPRQRGGRAGARSVCVCVTARGGGGTELKVGEPIGHWQSHSLLKYQILPAWQSTRWLWLTEHNTCSA
jgi:hypothetical protein